MSFTKRLIVLFAILVSCLDCDQATKAIAVSKLPEMKTVSYLGDTLRLQLTYNSGAFLGFGAAFPQSLKRSIFIIGTGIMLLGALAFVVFSKPGRYTVVLTVSLVFAGGVGNFIDRVLNNGRVVDFINIGIGPLRTGIFNIADIAIMAGAALLFTAVLGEKKKTAKTGPVV